MTRKGFEEFVFETYNVRADYPFEEDFKTGVFHHKGNGKWFSLAMHICEKKLGISYGLTKGKWHKRKGELN